MSETIIEPAADETSADGAQAQSTTVQTETDWQAKFAAQQKVNRDLEAKLKASLPKDEAETLRAKIAQMEGKEAEFTAAQERAKIQQEALAAANQRILKASLKAAATGKLADPTDAQLYLDLSKFEVGDDGEVDEAALTAAIEDLVKRKPHLAAQGGTTVITSPTTTREGPGATEEQQIVAAIAQAEKDRDFEKSIGLKHRLSALKAKTS